MVVRLGKIEDKDRAPLVNVKKVIILIGVVVSVAFFAEIIYANFKLRTEIGSGQDLNARLERLQLQAAKLSSALKEKELLLSQLSDAQALRFALSQAQATVDKMNKEFQQVASDRIALQQANLNLSTRIENTTKELMQATEDLRRAKAELVNSNKMPASMTPSQSPVSATVISEKEFNQLKAELLVLKQERKSLLGSSAGLEGRIRDLNVQNQILSQDLDRLRKSQNAGSEVQALYESAREQVRKLSDSLLSKDIELSKAKKQADQAQAQVATLTSTLDGAASSLEARQASQDDLNALETARLDLQMRLEEAQGELSKKTAVANLLQRNLDSTRQKLTQREEQQKQIEEQITELEGMAASLQDELKKKKSGFDEKDALYNSMRNQVSQLSETLARKEAELAQKTREYSVLNQDAYNLKIRLDQVEGELDDVRMRQRKTLEDLTQAMKLNEELRVRTTQSSQLSQDTASATREQQKADQLKKKIEVILEPDKTQ